MQYQKKQKNISGFPGSETWRSTQCVLDLAKTSPSSTTGFVMLFAVTLSALVLAMALGVSDIALREVKFGTSAKDTNEAFFAADVGYECALYYDQPSHRAFKDINLNPVDIDCAGQTNIDTNPVGGDLGWDFILIGLGQDGDACAHVYVDKSDYIFTVITSNGYNDGGNTCDPGPNTVERQIQASYLK